MLIPLCAWTLIDSGDTLCIYALAITIGICIAAVDGNRVIRERSTQKRHFYNCNIYSLIPWYTLRTQEKRFFASSGQFTIQPEVDASKRVYILSRAVSLEHSSIDGMKLCTDYQWQKWLFPLNRLFNKIYRKKAHKNLCSSKKVERWSYSTRPTQHVFK